MNQYEQRMKDSKYSILSVTLSCICITGLFYTNYKLAEVYKESDGKTKALFGIIELGHLSQKLLLVPAALAALLLLVLAVKKKERKGLYTAGFIFLLLAIIVFFVRVWVWMV